MKHKTCKRLTWSLSLAVTAVSSWMPVCLAEDPPAVPRKNSKAPSKKEGLLDKSQMTTAPASYSKAFSEAKLEGSSSDAVPEISNPRIPRSGSDKALWNAEVYTWHSPAFCYQPLYFEQPSLERYGIKARPVLNPIVSAGHFYVSVFALPWNTVRNRPWDCTCTLGQMRPGNCKTPVYNQTTVTHSLPPTIPECAPMAPEFTVGSNGLTDPTSSQEINASTAEYFQVGTETNLVPASAKRNAITVKISD